MRYALTIYSVLLVFERLEDLAQRLASRCGDEAEERDGGRVGVGEADLAAVRTRVLRTVVQLRGG